LCISWARLGRYPSVHRVLPGNYLNRLGFPFSPGLQSDWISIHASAGTAASPDWHSVEVFSMKRFFSFSLAVFCCVCLLVATERRALAYIDPGSGILALQSAASVMAAVGYFMRRRILALFGKKPSTATPIAVVVKNEPRKAA
jgi:hypothetical protein